MSKERDAREALEAAKARKERDAREALEAQKKKLAL